MTIAFGIAVVVLFAALLYIHHQEKLIDGYKAMLGSVLKEIEDMQVAIAEEWEKERNENGDNQRKPEEEV